MKRKILYFVKSNLHYYPPCMSQIKILHDIGINVTVLYGSSDEIAIRELEALDIRCVQMQDPRGVFPWKLDKVNNWLAYRKAVKSFLSTVDPSGYLLWFGNAESFLPLKGLIENRYDYVISYLELLDQERVRIQLLKKMTQKAKAVTTCEKTRSYLMQAWFDLEHLPYTIPNKPYSVKIKKNAKVTTEKGKQIMEALSGNKYIIYQGIFQNTEYIETLAKVLNDHHPDLYLVMMGIDKYHNIERIKKIYNNTIIVDYIPAPMHLEVTSNAYIGLLFYHPDSLNKVFCAPNKIFEYSCFGLPIIGNAIPGLENTIGKAGAGICTNFTYEELDEAIRNIKRNYSTFSTNSYAFFDSVDNTKTITSILESVGVV